ncbi:MAG: hypothetical protein LUF27_14450 [Lachnospiraceae bacterium]|nr:hypothetical protein [Lachnospiraceae bacterium]
MKGRQIVLSERIRRINQGIAADESALTYAIQSSASLGLKDFFLDPTEYLTFMEAVRNIPLGFGMEEPRTYLDAAELIAFCLCSDDRKLQKTGNKLLYTMSTNYIDLFAVLYRRIDEQYRKSMHDVVREKSISAKPLNERLGSIPAGKTDGFPVLHLPTNQLYQGASVLAGNRSLDEFYKETVLPCVERALGEQKNLKNFVADMAYCGALRATCSHDGDDSDDDDDYDSCADKDMDDTFDIFDLADWDDDENCEENTQTADALFSAAVCEKNRLIWYLAIVPYVASLGKIENVI